MVFLAYFKDKEQLDAAIAKDADANVDRTWIIHGRKEVSHLCQTYRDDDRDEVVDTVNKFRKNYWTKIRHKPINFNKRLYLTGTGKGRKRWKNFSWKWPASKKKPGRRRSSKCTIALTLFAQQEGKRRIIGEQSDRSKVEDAEDDEGEGWMTYRGRGKGRSRNSRDTYQDRRGRCYRDT
ncbi:unnamed protein product [Rhizophagus irregularis]|nr:unnamed protein product [Rhizophagus irregularis]